MAMAMTLIHRDQLVSDDVNHQTKAASLMTSQRCGQIAAMSAAAPGF
jgi:hypothetical protein